jgi:hypothetical protein
MPYEKDPYYPQRIWLDWTGNTITGKYVTTAPVWTAWNSATTASGKWDMAFSRWVTNPKDPYPTTLQTITAGTTVSDATWQVWTNGYAYPVANGYTPAPQTPEMIAQAAERHANWLAAEEKRKQEAAAAEAVAMALLRENLSLEQLRQLDEMKAFDVVAESGRRYRIKAQGHHGNIRMIAEDGTELESLCVAPTNGVPSPDAWLGQKLALETDEAYIRAKANITTIRRATPVAVPAGR